MEPPRGTEPQAGIMAGQGRQLAGVGALIQGEQDQGEIRARADSIEEGLQGADIVGARWNVRSLIGAEPAQKPWIMIAPGACMQLHDHAVVARHQSHLSQHLGAKQLGVALFRAPAQDAVQQGLRLDFRKIGCTRAWMAMVTCARPVARKIARRVAIAAR